MKNSAVKPWGKSESEKALMKLKTQLINQGFYTKHSTKTLTKKGTKND
jgi:hypothetical protein